MLCAELDAEALPGVLEMYFPSIVKIRIYINVYRGEYRHFHHMIIKYKGIEMLQVLKLKYYVLAHRSELEPPPAFSLFVNFCRR